MTLDEFRRLHEEAEKDDLIRELYHTYQALGDLGEEVADLKGPLIL